MKCIGNNHFGNENRLYAPNKHEIEVRRPRWIMETQYEKKRINSGNNNKCDI